MCDEYFNPPPSVAFTVPAVAAPVPADSTSSPSSTLVDQDAPSLKPTSKESSSRDVIPTNVHSVNQPPEHLIWCIVKKVKGTNSNEFIFANKSSIDAEVFWKILNLCLRVQGADFTEDALVMRTASAAAKPYQGDSSKFYLITGRNPEDGHS
nr:hypothetical protein [Tanacetum cinerariifolium]